jgi:hypothetical protein
MKATVFQTRLHLDQPWCIHPMSSESGRNIHDATSVLGWHVWNLEKGVCAMFRFQTKVFSRFLQI